jgi:hypothetical protein
MALRARTDKPREDVAAGAPDPTLAGAGTHTARQRGVHSRM